VGERFGTYGEVLEIRRNRVCFLRDDNTLAYIDIPEERIQVGQPLPQVFTATPQEGIARVSDTDLNVKKSYLMKTLQDPQLLFQAQAIPFTTPEGVKGFKVLSIQPGSVYEALGIQANDVIVGVDGSPIDSVGKAQELFSTLRTRDNVAIEILRGGKSVTMNYRIAP
jgi:S1-C subfamily serine protease